MKIHSQMVMAGLVLIGVAIGMATDQIAAGTLVGVGLGLLVQPFLKKGD